MSQNGLVPCSWMHSLMLRAMTAVEQPALTLSYGGLTSAASELTHTPENGIVRILMMVTCKTHHDLLV